jgi:hypothetical protein
MTTPPVAHTINIHVNTFFNIIERKMARGDRATSDDDLDMDTTL